MLWRQGDVLIETITAIPSEAQLRSGPPILVTGEATGHAHRLEDADAAEIWELGSSLYLKVLAETRIIHDEHGPISLPVGLYRIWQQREYTPEDIRTIRD
jgi:hypothetical protein